MRRAVERVPTVGPSRRMTRTHGLLWTVVLAATVVDVVSTVVGTAGGLTEGNPVVGAAMATLGLPGLYLVKLAAMLWLVGGWYALSDRDAAVFLGLFAAVTVVVAVHNATVVL